MRSNDDRNMVEEEDTNPPSATLLQPHDEVRTSSVTGDSMLEQSQLNPDGTPMERSTSVLSDATINRTSDSPPVDTSNTNGVSIAKWTRAYERAIFQESYTAQTQGEIVPEVIERLHQTFSKLCLDFEALPEAATRDGQIYENYNIACEKHWKYFMASSNNRHEEAERKKQQQQVVHSAGKEDTARKEPNIAEYFMLRDDIEDLPKFTTNIYDYAAWRARFRKALDEIDNSNPRKIIKWLEREVYPALDREVQILVAKETTV